MQSSLGGVQTLKCLKKEREGRFNSLPDELLTRILSLLPTTKDAIRTSILSTRWKYLWTCIPNHKFEYDVRAGGKKFRWFTDSVDRLFVHLLHDSRLCIVKFSVISNHNKNEDNHVPNVDAWISSLISRNIKKINLEFDNSLACHYLPSSLFASNTLVVLKVSGNFELDLSTSTTSIFLPKLKTLKLCEVKYSNEDTVMRLLSGCPILEGLTMERNLSADDVKCMKIASPSLKILDIHFFANRDLGDFSTIIDAPNLRYLTLRDYASTYILLHKTPFLVDADLDVMELQPSFLVPNLMGALLLAISQVIFLKLGCGTMELLTRYDYHLPKFRNVKHLTLNVNLADSGELLTNMLESMPTLQELEIEILADYFTGEFEWIPSEDVPDCLSHHLKTIELGSFFGGKDEVNLAMYFLENGEVLEKMTISACNDSDAFVEDQWLMSREELLKSPLGSSACQLKFI